jgi:hypothetical protein
MTFDESVELDDRVFELLETDGKVLFEKIGTTTFPRTYRAMFGFCAKTNALKTAMFDMIESNNPYVFKALYRCYCEHYLKFIYIFTRFVKERSDTAGTEYFAYCGAAEAREYASAIATMERLLGNEVNGDVQSVIAKRYPEAADLSTRQLDDVSAQFKYRAILRFLARETGFVGKQTPFLTRIVPVYAELSSFVHGGPSGDLDIENYNSPTALAKCKEDWELVVLLTASVLRCTALAVAREFRDVSEFYAKVSIAMKAKP